MGWFRKKLQQSKTCAMCEHYSVYRDEDKINPVDKAVTRGDILCVACSLWNMELTDLESCDRFERPWESTRMIKYRGSAALSIYMEKNGLFDKPPVRVPK